MKGYTGVEQRVLAKCDKSVFQKSVGMLQTSNYDEKQSLKCNVIGTTIQWAKLVDNSMFSRNTVSTSVFK